MRDIERWEKLTNKITAKWIKEYFELEEDDYIGADWISSCVGGVFTFSDYYFNFSDVLDCYKYNIKKEQLFSWYDYCMDNPNISISLSTFILSPQEKIKKEQKEQKELIESEQRMIQAKQELFNLLNNYGK